METDYERELREIKKREIEKNKKEYTVPKVLREYEKLGVTKLSDKKYHIRYKLTNKQKNILKQIGINEKEYIEFAREVIKPLDKH